MTVTPAKLRDQRAEARRRERKRREERRLQWLIAALMARPLKA